MVSLRKKIAAAITAFLELDDTPASYSGQAGKYCKVNAGEDALEFATVAAAAHQVVTAEGITSISTNSIPYVDMADMEVTITTSGGKVLLFFSAVYYTASGYHLSTKIIRDSIDVAGTYFYTYTTIQEPVSIIAIDTPTAGTHTYKVQWKSPQGTSHNLATNFERRRRLIAIELIN